MSIVTSSTLGDMLKKHYSKQFSTMQNFIDLKNGWWFAGYEKYKGAYGKHIRYSFRHCQQSTNAILIENQKKLKVTCKSPLCNESITIPDWQLFAMSLAMKT